MPKPRIDLRPNTLDLELYAGDGASIQLAIMDNEGRPIPIEGEVIAHIREARLDASPMAEFDADLTDSELGIVLVSLTGEKTAALIDTELLFSGAWDVQWVAPGSEPITLIQGRVKCYADVTR